jgi:hypothetical protein
MADTLTAVGDMLAFARMFLRGGGSVLSAESVRAMTTDQLTPEQKARGEAIQAAAYSALG